MDGRGIERVLDVLENFSERTHMYVQPVEIATVQSYLAGLTTGCSMCGVTSEWPAMIDFIMRAGEARGWEQSATGFERQMQAKGMDDAAIIQELIAIHIAAFRLAAQSAG